MNEPVAFFPRNIFVDFDNFVANQFNFFYKQFTLFWGTHQTFCPCDTKTVGINSCSKALICDGHMKIRRRLCANSNVIYRTMPGCHLVFRTLLVGCSNTPSRNSNFCQSCQLYTLQTSSNSVHPDDSIDEQTLSTFSATQNDMTSVC